ncbi:coil containing protein [Vibrio phage 1.161.O._10N.261.48.C5]|nr:coil containing protein [Vibrio phage 1.161.O._10N.261.48.C5]
MSDLDYNIAVKIKDGLSALKSFKQAATSFDKGRMTALVAQKNMLEQMKKLHDGMYTKPIKPPSSPTQPTRPTRPTTPDSTFVGPQIDKNTQKFLKKQAEGRLAAEQRITKEKGKQSRKDAARLSSLEKAKENVRNSALMAEKEASATQRAAQSRIKSKIALAKSAAEVREIVAQERASLRLAKKKSFLVNRMNASSKEFAGNMVSAFAVAAGGVWITQVSQDFERANNTLMALTGSAEEASKEMEYLKQFTYEMGLPLRETAKDYSKFMAAVGDKLPLETAKTLFEDLGAASVVMGTSAEDSSGVFKALGQMLSKEKVQAEEYRGQLGDRMPIALEAMTKASVKAGVVTEDMIKKFGSASGAMEKLMENGKLYSKDILPFFGEEIRKVVSPGLENAMKGNIAWMGRMVNAAENAAYKIGESGWLDGLTEVFKSIAKMLKENELVFEEFGEFMGKVFKTFAWAVDNIVSPVVSAFGSVLKFVNDSAAGLATTLGAVVATILGKFWKPLKKVVKELGGMKVVMRGVMFLAKRMFFPFFLGLAVLEEIAEFFSPTGKKTLIGFNIDNWKNPFKPWLDTMNEIIDKFKAFTGNNGTSLQVSSEGAASIPYNMRQIYQPKTQSQYPAINLQGDVYLDSESVGRQVMKTESAKSAVRYQSGYGAGSNR